MPSRRFFPGKSGTLPRRISQAGATLVAIAGLWLAVPAVAQVPDAAPSVAGECLPDYADVAERRRDGGPGFVDVTVKLAFVLALFGGAVVLYRKYGKPVPTFGGEEIIKLWANRSLGLGSEMYLIEVGDRMLLIGKSGTSISALSEFRDPAVVADLKSQCVGPMALPGGTSIWDRLTRREGLR